MKRFKALLFSLFAISAMLSAPALANDEKVRIAIENLGYRITAESSPALTDFEKAVFKMVSKRTYAIKRSGRTRRPPPRDLSFVVKVEEYASETHAKNRVDHLASNPPRFDSRTTVPGHDFRDAFHVGNEVYVIITDKYSHVADGTLASVASKFQEWIIDATS